MSTSSVRSFRAVGACAAAVVAFSLTACGGASHQATPNGGKTPTATSTAVPTVSDFMVLSNLSTKVPQAKIQGDTTRVDADGTVSKDGPYTVNAVNTTTNCFASVQNDTALSINHKEKNVQVWSLYGNNTCGGDANVELVATYTEKTKLYSIEIAKGKDNKQAPLFQGLMNMKLNSAAGTPKEHSPKA